ncbi:MAG: hypothetical protein KY454_03045 [Actinobacteria bacterium]|nr:hypothetical protein [Actinomycetota bacterium]MBW3650015.1 hypothetical protein [Actinomycetota bacterium]
MPPDPSPQAAPVLPRPELRAEIVEAAAARSAECGFPSEQLARIRTAAARLSPDQSPAGDLRQAALLLERQAVLDLEVPTASVVPGVALIKLVLKKLMIWYLRFLGHQITSLGQATARFGLAVASRVDGVEAEVAVLQERVSRLEASLSEPARQ